MQSNSRQSRRSEFKNHLLIYSIYLNNFPFSLLAEYLGFFLTCCGPKPCVSCTICFFLFFKYSHWSHLNNTQVLKVQTTLCKTRCLLFIDWTGVITGVTVLMVILVTLALSLGYYRYFNRCFDLFHCLICLF